MTASTAFGAPLAEVFGEIDIYLFDQIQRGRITPADHIVDAGCGWGRNLAYLLRTGHHVFGVDVDDEAVQAVRALAARLAPALPAENFRVEAIERTTLPEGCATVVLSSAVLHFAADESEFEGMLDGMWRLLVSGGMLFCRLASTIGIESRVQQIGQGRRYRVPDGTERYLVDEPLLVRLTDRLGGRLLDPIKTTIVQDQRAMTTWVVRKN